MYTLKTLHIKGCPSGHQLDTKISKGKSVTENHTHTSEAESTIGEFHSSGTVDRVEKEDEGQRTPSCSGSSPYTDTEHVSYIRETYGS